MRRIGLSLAAGALLAAAPCASAQDLNAAVQAFNCGAVTPPPAVPDGASARMSDMENFTAAANAWQTSQQAIEHCLTEANNAMDHAVSARVTEYNQRKDQAFAADDAWRAAATSAHH